jgi:hypothetical protein
VALNVKKRNCIEAQPDNLYRNRPITETMVPVLQPQVAGWIEPKPGYEVFDRGWPQVRAKNVCTPFWSRADTSKLREVQNGQEAIAKPIGLLVQGEKSFEQPNQSGRAFATKGDRAAASLNVTEANRFRPANKRLESASVLLGLASADLSLIFSVT